MDLFYTRLACNIGTATQIQTRGTLPKRLFLAKSDPKAMSNVMSKNTANTIVFTYEQILN